MTKSILSEIGIQPECVDHNYNVSCHDLSSLKGAPFYINGDFIAGSNKLDSLIGLPIHIDGHCYLFNNNLTSLHNIHKHLKRLHGYLNCKCNPITSSVLGVLLINEIQGVWLDQKEVELIINRHLHADRDVFACQEELIENGFEEYARL